MAYKACEDCGTRLSDGYCPNCHEELAIFEQDPESEFSQEFMDQVIAQGSQRWERRRADAATQTGLYRPAGDDNDDGVEG